MSDIFREIEEEVRRDRYMKLWKAYGRYVVGVVVAVVIVVVGGIGWREYNARQALAESVRFSEAMELERAGEHGRAAAAFAAIAEDARSGYAALAALRSAAALAEAGDRAAAIAAYDRAAADGGVPRRFRDLAALLAAMHALDSADVAELERRLQPLTAGSNPWRHSARELAGLVRLKAGDQKGAREVFARLADDAEAPSGVRGRAAELLAALPEAG